MKTQKQKYFLTILVVLLSTLMVALAACTPAVTATPQAAQPTATEVQAVATEVQSEPVSPALATPVTDVTTVDDLGNTTVDTGSLQTNLVVSGELSEDEIASLTYMREEEKLAHDVYVALYDQWNLAVFQNIANSEQSHTDAVKTLLDAYGLEDPAAGNAPGEFVNADLQALYDQLVAQGNQSLSDALKVGAAIEEIDILDLEERLAQTEISDIQLVYENLMKGSRNHLRAFTSTLAQQTGETYQPQYLSTDVYQSIVGSAVESGGNGNRRGNQP